jgi:hypothetical protein
MCCRKSWESDIVQKVKEGMIAVYERTKRED